MKLFTVIALALGGLALYSAYLGILYFAQRPLLFPRPSVVPEIAVDDDREVTWLSTSSGKVESWYYPPRAHDVIASAHAEAGAPAVILAHGNAELIDTFSREFSGFRDLGMAVLVVEYPGYGRSQGSPTQQSVAEAF